MIDTEKIRKDFPIFNSNPSLVYLDSAATSQKPKQVIDVLTDFYTNKNSNISRGLYGLAENATAEYEKTREKVKKFINARDQNEIIFTANTTASINSIMRGWGEKFIKKNDKIVTTIAEHHSNFVPWQFLAKSKNAKFEVVDVDSKGEININDFERKCKGAKLVTVSAISNVLGIVNNTKQLSKIAHENDAICVLDGAQSVPSLPTDVRKSDCDFLAFSGHKMLGPFGVGVLYGKEDILESMDPAVYGSQMIRKVSEKESSWADVPHKFESGTPEVSAVVGLGAAIDYLNNVGMENIYEHDRSLIGYALKKMTELEFVKVLGSTNTKNKCSLVSFTLDNIHPHDVSAILAENNLCVRSGHHCAMPLHEKLGIVASTRASVYLYNNKSEIDLLIDSLIKIRKMFG
ncbi:MAG: SufS family cysteine desulfurase [Candidatus Micrarchaeota archaeon]